MRHEGKRGLSIKTRVFLQVAAIMAVCIFMLLFLNSAYLESVYLWNSKRSIAGMVSEIESTANLELTYYTKLPAYERNENVGIELYNSLDEMLYEGAVSVDYSAEKINVISREDNEEDSSYYLLLQAEGSPSRYSVYGKRMSNGYLIEVTALISPLEQSAKIATGFTSVLAVAGLLASLVFVSIFSRKLTKPLIEMNDITGEMAALDFKRKCSTGRDDEIGALAQNINLLSDTLDKTLEELNEKNRSLTDDIERERRLDGIRKEFISSVSHELKTPISIIRGYAEGLAELTDGGEEDTAKREYCDIIVSEADRMNSLVLQLLEISLYESGGYKLNVEKFDLHALVSEYFAGTKALYADKGITAVNDIPSGTLCLADKQRVYTVLNNYFSNAASHADGEKLIRCRCEGTENGIRVFVFNTGSQVDEQDSDKLFMSFYRGDKAHSRSEGRFGLGLSIVKAITEAHGKTCGFNNTDNGVEFWFELDTAENN